MAWDVTKQVVAGVLATAITAASSAIYAKFSPPEPKEGIQKIIYVVGSEINRSLGISVSSAETPLQSAEIPAQPSPKPLQPAPPPAITQETPFQSGDLYISDFKATRKSQKVLFSFSIRNTSQQTIFIALDDIAVSAESGKATTGTATGIKSSSHGQTSESYYTELGAGSALYVTADFWSSDLPDPTGNFNINMLQLTGGKSNRVTFGRPVAIISKDPA